MEVTEYISFYLISFKDYGSCKDVVNRDDIIHSVGLEKFISDLKDMPNKKTQYLKYWNELQHRNKLVLGTYDELLKDYHNILNVAEKLFQKFEHDCFIVRMKSSQINYLRQSDIEIECIKVLNEINPFIDTELRLIDDKVTMRLDNLYKRTEIAFNRIREYAYHKNDNPNLKIQNKIGYLLSEIP